MGNVKSMAEDGIDAYVPEERHGMPDKKTGMLKPECHESRFAYNSEKDFYMCPEKKKMHYLMSLETMKGLKYRVCATVTCESCPVRTGCTESGRGGWIWRWEHQDILVQHRNKMKLIGHEKMKKRKSIVEHPFGTMKRAMNAGYTLLKRNKKLRENLSPLRLRTTQRGLSV